MNTIFLNIGHDLVRHIIDLIDYLNALRDNSALSKILLWPFVYALTFIKVITNYLAVGGHNFYNYSMPYNILTTRNHFLSATPMSVYCFNKTGFALLFVEMVFFFYFMCVPMEESRLIVPYLLAKFLLMSVPFVALTPIQRLPFWLAAIVFTAFEARVGDYFICTWGYGIDFEHGHFYNHWAKHYRYRAITSNRIIGTELSRYIYAIIKILILNDYFCYNADVLNTRIEDPHKPTWGAIANIDTDNDGSSFPWFWVIILLGLCFFSFCLTMRLQHHEPLVAVQYAVQDCKNMFYKLTMRWPLMVIHSLWAYYLRRLHRPLIGLILAVPALSLVVAVLWFITEIFVRVAFYFGYEFMVVYYGGILMPSIYLRKIESNETRESPEKQEMLSTLQETLRELEEIKRTLKERNLYTSKAPASGHSTTLFEFAINFEVCCALALCVALLGLGLYYWKFYQKNK